MDLEKLLQMLGVATIAEASAAITRFNAMLASILELTGAVSGQGALELLTKLKATLGGLGGDAFARVEAWKASAERLPALETELNTLRRGQLDMHAATLMQKAIQEGRLPPGLKEKAEAFYAAHGVEALQTFLETLPVQATPPGNTPRQAPLNRTGAPGPGELSASERIYMKATGRDAEELRAADQLWEQTNGVITDGHVRQLNEAALKRLTDMPIMRAS